MTILGTTNNSLWSFKLEATEIATSIENNTSTVKVEAFLTRTSSQSYIGGYYSGNLTVDGQTQSYDGTIPYPTYINPNQWYSLGSKTFTVTHNADGSKTASVSGTMTSSVFTPSSCSASGSIELSQLHKAPEFTYTLSETNTSLTGVTSDKWVLGLSKKKFTITVTNLYDSATFSKAEIYQGSTLIQSSSSKTIEIDTASKTLTTTTVNNVEVLPIIVQVTDSKNGVSKATFNYTDFVKYFKPEFTNTSTNATRNGQTSGKVNLNSIGQWFNGNIGSVANTLTIKYKYWAKDGTEPSTFNKTVSTVSKSGNSFSITNYELGTDFDFTKPFYVKLQINDAYTTGEVITKTVPSGEAVWTEYKDRVDFKKITVKKYNPFEYSTEETICGVWLGKTLYRKVLNIGSKSWTTGEHTFTHSISNFKEMINLEWHGKLSSNSKWYNEWDSLTTKNWTSDTTKIYINSTGGGATFSENYFILEYTKTSD